MQLSINQLRHLAPLAADAVLAARTDKATDAPLQIDELERAARLVPTEAKVVQRFIKKMTPSTVGAEQGARVANVVVAAAASLHAATVSPAKAKAAATSPPLKGLLHASKQMFCGPFIQANDKLVSAIGLTHAQSLTGLTTKLDVVWSFKLEKPRAYDAHPDGSVVVGYRQGHGSGTSYTPRLLLVSPTGDKGRDQEVDFDVTQVVCAPDGGFFVVGRQHIAKYEANGDKRWSYECEYAMSPITLDEDGHAQFSSGRVRYVLDDNGAASERWLTLTGSGRWAETILGPDITIFTHTDTTIERVDGDIATSHSTETPLSYKPLLLRDGRLVLTHRDRIDVFNPDWTPSWSSEENEPSQAVEAPDGTLHVFVSDGPEGQEKRRLVSFSPTGARVAHALAKAAPHSSGTEPFVTSKGHVVIAKYNAVDVYE